MKTDNFNNITGVILAAGQGNRMGQLGKIIPKPLLPVGNKPIMEYQLDSMISLGIKDFIFVIGHLGQAISEYFGDGKEKGINIRYVEQKERLGIAHAISQLESLIHNPFLLFLGDIFLIPDKLELMLEVFNQRNARAVLATKIELDEAAMRKNFAVMLHNSGLIHRVIEKPRYMMCDRKGCGIYLFDPIIFDAIRRTPRTAMRDEYEITTSVQKLIDDGFPVYDAQSVALDMNITTLENLLECNMNWLQFIKQENLFSNKSKINPKAVIKNSVIGCNVSIDQDVVIENSVIFNNVKISSGRTVKNMVCYESI